MAKRRIPEVLTPEEQESFKRPSIKLSSATLTGKPDW